MKETSDQLKALSKATTVEEKKEALTTYLGFLCETEECRTILKELLSHLEDVQVKDNLLVVFIPWDYTDDRDERQYARIVFRAPYTGSYDESVPESFRKIFRMHNGIAYSFVRDLTNDKIKYYPWQFFGVDGEGKIVNDGGWESEAIEEGGNEDVIEFLENEGKSVEDVQCVGVFDDAQNWYLLHPMKKNKSGEPGIVQFDHGDCDLSSNEPFEYGLGAVVIRELAGWIRSIR